MPQLRRRVKPLTDEDFRNLLLLDKDDKVRKDVESYANNQYILACWEEARLFGREEEVLNWLLYREVKK